MGSKKLSGSAKGYLILLSLVVVSWVIFKILTPHNFGSFSNMLNYFQASLIATVGAVGFYFVMVMGMFDFSIGANIMLSAIVGCVLATKFNIFRTDRRRYSYRHYRWFIKLNLLCKIKNSIYDRYNRSGAHL